MRRVLLGPVVADLDVVGLDSDHLIIASAFYSRQRLDALVINAARLDLPVRLNTSDLTEWISGAIAPDALLDFARRLTQGTVQVRLSVGPAAHAKVYLGASGFLVGSANLTVRGFGGLGNEILWYEGDRPASRAMRSALESYRAGLRQLELEELAEFVAKNRLRVQKAQAKLRRTRQLLAPAEDMLPRLIARPARLGNFHDFVKWLDGKPGEAPQLISRRARGEGQLSGHIKRNFFGLRQLFIGHPQEMQGALRLDPRDYALHRDLSMRDALRSFVLQEAVDEDALSVSTWRTYLPQSAGGKPKSGGGTSGNLKRMIPLVAKYLNTKVG